MQAIIAYIVAHQQFLIGAGAGFAVAHIGAAVAVAFHLAMKVPFLRSAITKNPDQAKAIIKAIVDELNKDIDDEARVAAAEAAPAAAQAAAPAAAAAAAPAAAAAEAAKNQP